MRMGIGLGVGINRSNYAQGIFGAYATRVVADGGVVEAGACVDAVSGLLLSASLLLVPSGYKGGKLYAEIPTNGNGDLTWTRGSDGFRTNASGLIQRVPWNLLSYSEDFSNAYWSKDAGVTVDTNVDIAPNGTTTADRLNLPTNGAVYRSGMSLGTGSFTLSVWLKGEGANIGKQVLLELSNGNSTVTLTGDWQRFTTTGTNVINVAIKRLTSGQASAVLAWGIQIVEGTTAQTYLPTTDRLNFPRLDYTYGSCPAVLLEPQRTNLLPNQLSYTSSTGVAYNTSVTDSPIIGINSARITKNQAAGTLQYAQQNCANSALTGSTTYTISAYFKYDGYDFQTSMEFNSSLQWGGVSWTQLINIASTGVTLGSSTSCTGSVQNAGNGWYRVSVTITTGAVIGGITPVTYLMRLPSTLSTGQGFLQAVPQLEQGAYSTTVIPTSGATATRVADSFSRNNIYTNGLITSSGGTWFVELRGNVQLSPDIATIGFWLGTNSVNPNVNGTLYFRQGGGSQRSNIWKYESGTGTQLYTITTDTTKIAIKWNGTTADIFVNGIKVVSATTFTATNMEFLTTTGVGRPFFIQQMALYPSPLSDTDCTTLTTL